MFSHFVRSSWLFWTDKANVEHLKNIEVVFSLNQLLRGHATIIALLPLVSYTSFDNRFDSVNSWSLVWYHDITLYRVITLRLQFYLFLYQRGFVSNFFELNFVRCNVISRRLEGKTHMKNLACWFKHLNDLSTLSFIENKTLIIMCHWCHWDKFLFAKNLLSVHAIVNNCAKENPYHERKKAAMWLS